MQVLRADPAELVIAGICNMDWQSMSEKDMIAVSWAYYFFSIQFRENLELACEFFPADTSLMQLHAEECNTDNLSPFPEIAIAGERLNHDEFMRRVLCLAPVAKETCHFFIKAGDHYLSEIRSLSPYARALSIASYEDGGLDRIFTAFLTAPAYKDPALQAFRFFLTQHIKFDSDPTQGHGSLARHLTPDETIIPIWQAFKDLLITCTPKCSTIAVKDKFDAICHI